MKRILIVEDDTIFSGILMRTLSRRGYLVNESSDIAGAEAAFVTHGPDAVILDVNVNGENGLDLIPPIQRLNPETRIVVLTSYGNPRTAAWAIRNGATHYLSKPVDAEEIIFALEDDGKTGKSVPKAFMSPNDARDAHILQFFAINDCNVSQTARDLGMHRRTLQRILDRLRSFTRDQNRSKFGRARRLANLWSRLLGLSQDADGNDRGEQTSSNAAGQTGALQ